MPTRLADYLLLMTGLFSFTAVAHAGTLIGKPEYTVGGRVKLDAVYNVQSTSKGKLGRGELAFSPGSIPVSGDNPDSFNFNLRESRLWATGHLLLFNRDLAAYAEIDFYSIDRNALGRAELTNKPRLRHAYATYGGFTVGKTYTTFLNVPAYPETNDVNGPVAILNVRQELLRYRRSFDWGGMTLSLEEPDSQLTTATGSSVRADDEDWVPDIITRLDIENDWSNWSVSALAREIRSDGLVAALSDNQWGAALAIAGRIYTTGQDNIRFSIAGGNVLGRYLSYNAFDDAVMDHNGQIDLTEIFGTYLAYQHWWTRNIRSSLTVGYARAYHDLSVAPDTVDKHYYSTHLNLVWSPTLNSSIGAEWLHGFREQEDGRDGHLDRLQFTLIYKF